MKTKEELEKSISKYKGIIFGNDTPISRECLNELTVDKRVHVQKLRESTSGKLTWDSSGKT